MLNTKLYCDWFVALMPAGMETKCSCPLCYYFKVNVAEWILDKALAFQAAERCTNR